MSDELYHTLVQLSIEKQNEKDVMIKYIQELEQKLVQLKNDHYELHGEVESLEHVIELLNKK